MSIAGDNSSASCPRSCGVISKTVVSKQGDAMGKQLLKRHVDGDALSVLDQVEAGGCT